VRGHVFLLAPAIRGDLWRYRLTGLLAQPDQHVLSEDRPNRAAEAIAVLLTQIWLHDDEVSDRKPMRLLDTRTVGEASFT
jgi:hypothetical protein